MSKIKIILSGGLGNQMFQYAMGRALSLKNNANLVIDQSIFQFYKRKYKLDYFKLSKGIKTINSLNRISVPRLLIRCSSLLKLIAIIIRPFILYEKDSHFDPAAFNHRSDGSFAVVGYWQDERYFSNISSVIRDDFTANANYSIENQLVAAKIMNCENPIAVHVRRLHGVETNSKGNPNDVESEKIKRAVGVDYYNQALNIIYDQVKNPIFFIFSDYPLWAENNLNIKGQSFFLNNSRGPDAEDISLMSLCKHHIIANSSFSWWGAWLSCSPEQIVIAPKNIMNMPNIPKRWHSI